MIEKLIEMLIWWGLASLKLLGGIFIALVLGYIFVRVVSVAAARSWLSVREQIRKKRGEKNAQDKS